jgi:hypothetical protein
MRGESLMTFLLIVIVVFGSILATIATTTADREQRDRDYERYMKKFKEEDRGYYHDPKPRPIDRSRPVTLKDFTN